MTELSDLTAAFEGLGVPIARVRFHEDVNPPYAVYYGAGDAYSDSDDTHERTLFSYRVYVYMDDYDIALIHAIEDALNASYIGFKRGNDGYDADRDKVIATFQDIKAYER